MRIKTICSTQTEKKKHCERGYEENILNDKIYKVDNIDRKDLLSKKDKSIKDRIPCLITYNRKFPMMRKIINKHCSSNKSGVGRNISKQSVCGI